MELLRLRCERARTTVEFLLRLKQLSNKVETTFPKDTSSSVELAAKMIIKKHGQERLGSVAKLHFKTTQAVLAGLA
jgi:ribonuclease HIII